MKVQLEHILQNLFHKPSLNEVNVAELESMVKEHPYFSAGHFLLAQKLRHTGEYEPQAQKAALYFYDPLWLQWQLREPGNGTLEQEEELAVTTVGPVEEGIPATPEEVRENMPDEEIITEVVSDEVEEEDGFDEPKTEEPAQEFEEPSEEYEHPAEQESLREPESFHEPEQPRHEAELVQQQEQETVQAMERPIPETSIEPIDHTYVHKPDPPVIQEKPLAFDPYYTIDYFASQGIKAPAEVQPGDKLGRQLKSFTEWLKTMKRLPQAQPNGPTTEADEQKIRNIAAGSLEGKEVLTEAMAEVLQKQGRNAEAIGIYEKLSLSDPSKSAYFAAKIENLKAN